MYSRGPRLRANRSRVIKSVMSGDVMFSASLLDTVVMLQIGRDFDISSTRVRASSVAAEPEML